MTDKEPAGKCPVNHDGFVSKTSSSKKSNKSESQDSCPVLSGDSSLRPENMMPILTQEKAIGQKINLPTSRIISSIPKGTTGNWEYPSPQQFYNALKKKGWETPEEEIVTMVDIHNWMNEGSWQEILQWEKKYHCDCKDIKLKKFQGRPQELSPKARFLSTFKISPPPFDRHDWTIDRCGKEVRYVIDYYSLRDSPQPEFSVDVRPALDSPTAFFDRTREVMSELWNTYIN